MRVAFTFNLKTNTSEEEAEFDAPETVAMIEQALRELGHEVALIEASGSVRQLIDQLEAFGPDFIFNTAEGGIGRGREAYYPSLFQRLGIPFAGSDAYVCTVTLDKMLTKLVVERGGVRVPRSILARSVRDLDRIELRLPVIVKPNFEGSSMGITDDSVVDEPDKLAPRLERALARFPDGVLVEEYITGRDVVVPFLESVSPETGGILPAAEYVYPPSDRRYPIFNLDMKAKGFQEVQVRAPAVLTADQLAEVQEQSRRAVESLGVRDFGRIDYRVSDDGTVFFLEMNALPSLEPGASLYLCGELIGLDGVTGVVGAVLDSATRRYPALPA